MWQRVVLPPSGTSTSWRKGLIGTSWSSERGIAKSCPGEEPPQASVCAEVPVDTKLNVSPQCAFPQRRLMVSWAAVGGELPTDWGWCTFFPSAQQRWGHTCSAASSSGLPSTRKAWDYWGESSKGPWKWQRDWNTSPARKGWEVWDCFSLEKRKLRAI